MTNKVWIILLTLLLAGPASAQERDEKVAPASPWYLSITTGWDSRYVLYGYSQSGDLFRGDIYASYAINEKTTLWAGSWGGYLSGGTYSEVDGYAGVDHALGAGFIAGLAYSMFHYLEAPFTDESWVSEYAAHVSYQRDRLFLDFRDHYDTEADGRLARAITQFTQPVHPRISLVASAEFGYAFEYFIEGNLPNHALFTIKMPCQVSALWSLSPYLAYSRPLEAINDYEDSDFFGGISITWAR